MVDELRIEKYMKLNTDQSHFKVYLWSHKSNKETFIIITKKATKDFSADGRTRFKGDTILQSLKV
jgi:hypothetical protein